MTDGQIRRIFASYSRKDSRSVHELVRLMRMTGAPVFLDTDSIPAGENWREILTAALQQADLVAVFWSYNSAMSEEVRKEYQFAAAIGKRIVPVMMDETPLTEELAAFQGVNLVDVFSPHDASFDPKPYVAKLISAFGPWENAH